MPTSPCTSSRATPAFSPGSTGSRSTPRSACGGAVPGSPAGGRSCRRTEREGRRPNRPAGGRGGGPGAPWDRRGAAMERAEDERRLWVALDGLTTEHRTVLVLKEIEGRKYEVIADLLGV